jgi:uncharacterized protein
MSSFDYRASTALVTGASRGIGAALSRELASRNIARLVLVARSESELQALGKTLEAAYGIETEVLVADLSEPGAPEAIFAETERRGLSIDLLVNNAGFGSHGFFDALDPAREQAMIMVNVAALVALTRLYLPEMLVRGRGGVLNVASTASFVSVPFMATYAATKAFVLSFSEALWSETRERGGDVRVVCLCPGGTETNFGEALGSLRGKFEEAAAMTPEAVATVGLDALDRNASYVVAGAANWAGALASRFTPRAMMTDYVATIFRPEDVEGPSVAGAATRKRLGATALIAGLGALCVGVLATRKRG